MKKAIVAMIIMGGLLSGCGSSPTAPVKSSSTVVNVSKEETFVSVFNDHHKKIVELLRETLAHMKEGNERIASGKGLSEDWTDKGLAISKVFKDTLDEYRKIDSNTVPTKFKKAHEYTLKAIDNYYVFASGYYSAIKEIRKGNVEKFDKIFRYLPKGETYDHLSLDEMNKVNK